MKVKVYLVKAFTKDKTQGNPAGVVLKADGLAPAQMLRISSQLGFSESAFVSDSDRADFKVRFFSPKQEMDFCGHATIATFHVLRENGEIRLQQKKVTQETKAGIFPVECRSDGLIIMTQRNPEFGFIEHNRARIASLLSITPNDLLNYPIQSVSTGTPKLMIAVSSLHVLQTIKPNLAGIASYCLEKGTKGFYPFTSETLDKNSDYHARQFNPLAGINEDPITGVAAGALGSYVVKHRISEKKNCIVEQGFGMGKGGTMVVNVADDVKVGGYAVTLGELSV